MLNDQIADRKFYACPIESLKHDAYSKYFRSLKAAIAAPQKKTPNQGS